MDGRIAAGHRTAKVSISSHRTEGALAGGLAVSYAIFPGSPLSRGGQPVETPAWFLVPDRGCGEIARAGRKMSSKDELKREVCEAIDRHADTIIDLGETILRNPETG